MDDRWAWLRRAVRATEAGSEEEAGWRVLAGVAVAVAARRRVRLPDLTLLDSWGPPVDLSIPEAVPVDPWLVGSALEVLLGAGERRRRGSHHTPRGIAETVANLALGSATGDRSTTVCDPSVGGGVFLLATAEAFRAAGASRADALDRLAGVDVDPLAVAVTEVALCLWADGWQGGELAIADALARPADAWGAPTVVVGNPPFLGQLRSATTRPSPRAGLRPDLAALAGPYTDTSALFAALATSAVAPGGRVALVLPRSFLVARDAGAARTATLASAALEHVWVPGQPLFDAAVDVCVPVWARRDVERSPSRPVPATMRAAGGPDVRRTTGSPPRSAPPGAAVTPAHPTWSHLLAGLDDEPDVPVLDGLRTAGVLGDHATATAGFRDQYYGLIPFTVDDPGGHLDDETHAPLVTSGLIDPAASAWGRRTTRYARRRWEAPRIDVGAVADAGGSLARWTEGKRVPKLLVAAQTRTIEAVADSTGTWLPSTPVATVVPSADRYWHVLAVLLSPVATAWSLVHHRGSGLSAGAIRLPPSALRAIPTPAGLVAWDAGAEAVHAASTTSDEADRAVLLSTAARSTCTAYGIDPAPAVAWWSERLPTT